MGANYRAARRARSKREFVSKLGIVIEECDESAFWMELIVESELMVEEKLKDLMKEADEILAIIVTARNSAKRNSS